MRAISMAASARSRSSSSAMVTGSGVIMSRTSMGSSSLEVRMGLRFGQGQRCARFVEGKGECLFDVVDEHAGEILANGGRELFDVDAIARREDDLLDAGAACGEYLLACAAD